jgi:hypothetical protein
MAVICMREIKLLINRLREDFPGLVFERGEEFRFSPPGTVYYCESFGDASANEIALLTLHEAAHGLLEHKDYDEDVLLLKMECAAWERVKSMCGGYGVEWDEEFVEERMDSYRDWLHARGLCPVCGVSGWQDARLAYHCAVCGREWEVE